MISLHGKLHDIVKGENKDNETGEIVATFTAEVLHKSRGKSVVDSVKLDPSVVNQWTKAIGQDISVEVRFYAMKGRDGSITSGFTLADKKCLPVVSNPVLKAA